MVPTSLGAVQQFRVHINDSWQTITLSFRGEDVGSKYNEALWQPVGTLQAIKASSLHLLIEAGEVIPL